MKKLFAILLAALMILGLCACNKDAENENREFPLMTDAVIRYIDGENEQTMKMVFEYDDNQNIISSKIYRGEKLFTELVCDGDPYQPLSQTDYDENGNVQVTSSFTYDSNGRELTYTRKDKDGNVIHHTSNTYTPEGWLAREEYSYGEDEVNWITHTYDSYGNKTSQKSGQGEDVWSEETYENIYNGDKLVEVKAYDAQDKLSTCEKYDSDGNLIQSIIYSDMGTAHACTEYTYQNGKLVLRLEKWGEDEEYRTEYDYNDAGNVTEVRYTSTYGEESSNSKQVFTYENGVVSNVKAYENGELEVEYIFNYRKATMSKEQAEKLAEIYKRMSMNI